MTCTISTPPDNSLFALHTPVFTPLLALPFDNNGGGGLQSNACITPRSAKRIGLGLLFGDSPLLPVNDSLLGDHWQLLDSPQLPIVNDASTRPADVSYSRCSPDPENDCRLDTTLSSSSSAFSIGDWINHPSSSPVPSDAPCGSSTVSHDIESTPRAVSEPQDTAVNLHSLNMPAITTAPVTPAGINPAILTAPRIRSPLTGTDGFRGSMETVLLQVVERLCFGYIPATNCLSPDQTPFPRTDLASPRASEHPRAHTPELMYPEFDSHRSPGSLFPTPVEASQEFILPNMLGAGSELMSPRGMSSSDNGLLVSPDTPIFNVHEGISEYDLQRRANRYRRRYPGQSLDRHWLLRYAGKLNEDGKAIENYRLNKRRDHIIVHICSHVNERPFACGHCHMTFLRRNECKRHEAGHSGLKPFICQLCPSPAARFARQDLLTRHARRAHDVTNATMQREKRQRKSDVAARSGGEKDGSIRKRARMVTLQPRRNTREICLE
ncbi:hypothetical protein BGW80DRAFT_1284636 [Lactifluus volemus]|nr:hypothetical protein BGW80DRAFT_1284636 [Lactifluus volemus]